MVQFLVYSYKVLLCSGVFYLFYFSFLQKSTNFQLNRMYLLVTLLFSVLFPLIQVPLLFSGRGSGIEGYVMFYEKYQEPLNQIVQNQGQSQIFQFSFAQIVPFLYGLGVIFFLFRMFRSFFHLFTLKKGAITEQKDKVTFVLHKDISAPFSFFRYIFISPELFEKENGGDLIRHEQIHSFQLHSVDLLLAEFVIIFQWFNPFLLLYRKSLIEQHEYIADNNVITHTNQRIDYLQLLADLTFKNQKLRLSCQFNHSLTKKRLQMMTKISTHRQKWLIYFSAIPLILGMFYFISCSKDVEEPLEIKAKSASTILSEAQLDEGCSKEFVDSLAQQIGNAVLLRPMNTILPAASEGNKSPVQEFPMVLNDGIHYRFNVASPNGNGILLLYSTNKLLATTYNKERDKHYKQFDFECKKTGEYKVFLTMKDDVGGPVCGLLSFVGKTSSE